MVPRRATRAGRTVAMSLAVRRWVTILVVSFALLGLGAFGVPWVARLILGDESGKPTPRVHESLRAPEKREERFGTLRVVTDEPEAIVLVDERVRGGGTAVEVRGLAPLPQRHPVEVRLRGKSEWHWVEFNPGEEKTLRVQFGAQPPVAPRLTSAEPLAEEPPVEEVVDEPTPAQPAPALVPSGPRPFTSEVADLEPGELVWIVSDYYKVPACLLWAIWKKESALLEGGWRVGSADWYLGAEVIAPDGKCIEHDGSEKCTRHWYALVSLCKQERGGRPICDPNEVRSSYALAIGPMQHMPGELAKPCVDNPGEYCFTDDAQDFDGDRIFDPWGLADAMAATAFELRNYKAQLGSWRLAAIRYYGNPPERYAYYYDGREEDRSDGGSTRFRKGVKQYWQECCDETRGCGKPR